MWTNELIFSEGDLCDTERYINTLRDQNKPYAVRLSDRKEHLKQIIKRASAEVELIERLAKDGIEDIPQLTEEYPD